MIVFFVFLPIKISKNWNRCCEKTKNNLIRPNHNSDIRYIDFVDRDIYFCMVYNTAEVILNTSCQKRVLQELPSSCIHMYVSLCCVFLCSCHMLCGVFSCVVFLVFSSLIVLCCLLLYCVLPCLALGVVFVLSCPDLVLFFVLSRLVLFCLVSVVWSCLVLYLVFLCLALSCLVFPLLSCLV